MKSAPALILLRPLPTQERLSGIRAIHKQLQEYHEEGKTAVRVAEMREIKNKMQVGTRPSIYPFKKEYGGMYS